MKNSSLKSDPDIVRGTDKSCLDCQKKFSIMVREHQCKRCLKPVCSDCGSYRRQVYSSNFSLRDHRVCKSCKSASEEISNYVKSQDLRFASMSDIGKKWLKKITKKPSTFGTDTSQHKEFTRQYFGQLWGTYSFELRQLIGILTFKIQQEGIYSVVYGVYTTIISAAPQYKLSQVIHLIVFVLCFCEADKVPFIVLYLLELKQNQKDVKEVAYKYLKALPFTTELTKLEDFINYMLERFVDSFLVNCLTIDMSIYLINKILQRKNIEEMLIIFATYIFINREMLISKYKEDKLLLNYLMLRKCPQQSQLIANAKFFKGKQFSISNEENSDNLGYLNLRKAQTLNYEMQSSPSNSLLETYDIKIKPVFVNRSSAQFKDSKDNIQDSFSMYLEPNDKQNAQVKLSPSSPSIKDGKNLLEVMQYSPQNKSIQSNLDSPFKKMVAQDFGSDLPQLMELSKTSRKYTDGPDSFQVRNCEKCSSYHQQMQLLLKKIKQEKDNWTKQKESFELAKQNMSENINKLVEENFNRKTRINELQTVNNQNQNQQKALLQKLKKSQEELVKKDELLLQIKEEKKEMNQRLIKQSNQTIKMYALVQQEKRSVNQAREMFIQSKRNVEGSKLKLLESEVIIGELSKKVTQQTNQLQRHDKIDKKNEKAIIQLTKENTELKEENKHLKEKNDGLKGMMQKISQKAKVLTVQPEKQKIIRTQNHQILKLRSEREVQQNNMKELNLKIKRLQSDNKELRKEYQNMLAKFNDQKQHFDRLKTNEQKKIKEKEQIMAQKQTLQKTILRKQEEYRKQIQLIRHQVKQYKQKEGQLMLKLADISQLMMEIQEEKMDMADQLFNLNELIKENGISLI